MFDLRRAAIDGHPEIEMALVELWRQTGRRTYLELAAQMVERRGHGLSARARSARAATWTMCRCGTPPP